MRRLEVFRVDSPDSEVHFIIQEVQASENSECFIDMAEIKEVAKKEASKPLVLFREE